MKYILIVPFLVLLSCNNTQDKTALYPEAFSAGFKYLTTELGVMDPSVTSTFATDLDNDVIRKDFTEPERKRILAKAEFDIEQCIRIWETYKGRDLSGYVAEKYLHFLVPKGSASARGTNISFSAPIFNSDTMFLFYMVFETDEKNKESKIHRYMLFGKTEDSWECKVDMQVHEEM